MNFAQRIVPFWNLFSYNYRNWQASVAYITKTLQKRKVSCPGGIAMWCQKWQTTTKVKLIRVQSGRLQIMFQIIEISNQTICDFDFQMPIVTSIYVKVRQQTSQISIQTASNKSTLNDYLNRTMFPASSSVS